MLDTLYIQDSIAIFGYNIYSGCCMVTVQRLICAQKCTIGTSGTVLIREVSLFQRLICTQKCTIGTSETILIGDVISEVDLCTKVYYWDLRNYPDWRGYFRG